MEIKTPATIGPGEFFPVVGVGPHEKPWPTGDQYDPELLENGDRRNVLDHYRYWSVEAIVADLNTKRHGLQMKIGSTISILVLLYERQMHSMSVLYISWENVTGISVVRWLLIVI